VLAAIGCAGRTSLPASRKASPQAVPTVPMPVVIESFPRPAVSTPRRNVFAFCFVEERRSRLSPSSEGQARVPVLHEDGDKAETVTVTPPEPAPAYRYLGSFGPQETPILVYKGNGDVVNVPLRKP